MKRLLLTITCCATLLLPTQSIEAFSWSTALTNVTTSLTNWYNSYRSQSTAYQLLVPAAAIATLVGGGLYYTYFSQTQPPIEPAPTLITQTSVSEPMYEIQDDYKQLTDQYPDLVPNLRWIIDEPHNTKTVSDTKNIIETILQDSKLKLPTPLLTALASFKRLTTTNKAKRDETAQAILRLILKMPAEKAPAISSSSIPQDKHSRSASPQTVSITNLDPLIQFNNDLSVLDPNITEKETELTQLIESISHNKNACVNRNINNWKQRLSTINDNFARYKKMKALVYNIVNEVGSPALVSTFQTDEINNTIAPNLYNAANDKEGTKQAYELMLTFLDHNQKNTVDESEKTSFHEIILGLSQGPRFYANRNPVELMNDPSQYLNKLKSIYNIPVE